MFSRLIMLQGLLCIALQGHASFGLVIHGGAGTIEKSKLSPMLRQQLESTLQSALDEGYACLKNGCQAVDAVEKAVTVLENSPLFNAGKGASYTLSGQHVLEAAMMSGHDRKVGAVTQLSHVKNPIQLAKNVLNHSPHVMLAGLDAERFAKSKGLELVSQSYYHTPQRLALLKAWRASHPSQDQRLIFGTVGAVALDKYGHLAAGTSTGGMTGKMDGRIGDSPIIGAGTYANQHCAISATGHGEYFIRYHLAGEICDRAKYSHVSVKKAAKASFADFDQFGGKGGIIVLDDKGQFFWRFNSKGMYRGVKLSQGLNQVKIYS